MTHRHFGNPIGGRLTPWGHSGDQPSTYGVRNTHADLPKLPAESLRAAPVSHDVRERATKIFATVFLSLCFAIPLMLAGIMIRFK